MVQLYRPVGAYELVKIAARSWRGYPPRLPEQPIFYPVLDRGYGEEIAGRWNPGDPNSGYMGFLTSFTVPEHICNAYTVKVVGAKRHRELWIPADEQETFTSQMRDSITVLSAWVGPQVQEALPSWRGQIGRLEGPQMKTLIQTVMDGPLIGGPLTMR